MSELWKCPRCTQVNSGRECGRCELQLGEGWTIDEFGTMFYTIGDARVWLMARPAYCDRGHWYAGVEGIGSIDGADCFPRYYMDFTRAQLELQDWLQWRVRSEKQTT